MSERVAPITREGLYHHTPVIRYRGRDDDGEKNYRGMELRVTGLVGLGAPRVEGKPTERIAFVGKAKTGTWGREQTEFSSTGLHVRATKEQNGNWFLLRRARWTVEIGEVVPMSSSERGWNGRKKDTFKVLETLPNISGMTAGGARMSAIRNLEQNPSILLDRGVIYRPSQESRSRTQVAPARR